MARKKSGANKNKVPKLNQERNLPEFLMEVERIMVLASELLEVLASELQVPPPEHEPVPSPEPKPGVKPKPEPEPMFSVLLVLFVPIIVFWYGDFGWFRLTMFGTLWVVLVSYAWSSADGKQARFDKEIASLKQECMTEKESAQKQVAMVSVMLANCTDALGACVAELEARTEELTARDAELAARTDELTAARDAERGAKAAARRAATVMARLTAAEQMECIVCQDAPSVVAMAPCGHVCYCAGCWKEQKIKPSTCPLCRADIEAVYEKVG